MADEVELDDSSNFVGSSTNIDNFKLKDGETPDGRTLNPILARLIANDEAIAGSFENVPGVWFCRWFDNDLAKGYSKGDFFWVNTENVENFIRDNNKKIRDLANKSPFVSEKLPPWKNNDSEVFEMYYNALTGYSDNFLSKALQPIYYIGNLSNNFQIIVSQKDRNKDIPGTDNALSSWKNFAVNTDEDYERIMFTINHLATEAVSRHEENYHKLKNDAITQNDIYVLSVGYANEDFSNVKFSYPKNYVRNNFSSIGMDCVDVFVKRPYSSNTINGLYVEETWFRKWKSGYLEHGGLINVRRYLNERGDLVTVPFKWRMLDDNSKFYKFDYLGINEDNPIEIDESYLDPPGDNLISVLYELDSLIIDNSEYSPTYYSTDYSVILTPMQQQFEDLTSVDGIESYQNLGNGSIKNNILNCTVEVERSTKESFSFKYDPITTPDYYYYYVTGFCL